MPAHASPCQPMSAHASSSQPMQAHASTSKIFNKLNGLKLNFCFNLEGHSLIFMKCFCDFGEENMKNVKRGFD
jgi:hypothetical protein